MKILITAIGRRVELVEHLRKSLYVIGVDINNNVAAKEFVDKFYIVPKFDSNNYISSLLEICKKEKVQGIIPLFEKEFDILNKNREILRENNVELILSNEKTIRTFNDKENTDKFFLDNNIKTPQKYTEDDLEEEFIYPVIIKPRDGMGSRGVFKANNKEEGKFFYKYVENPIAQKFINGEEYTVDLFCDIDGDAITVIPRKRIEVRSGEVSKTSTVKDMDIIKEVIAITKKIKFFGPITIQCIKDDDGNIFFIEINPRFGGGVTASIYSGVDYSFMIKSILKKEKLEPIIGNFDEKLVIRYDRSVIK